MKLNFSIVTQEGPLFESEVDSVTVPTTDGVITILPRHIPLVALLVTGELKYQKEGSEYFMSVSRGMIEVRHQSHVVVLADSAERAEHIDIERAEAARQRALKMLEEKEKIGEEAFALVQAQLEKELARIRVSNRYRKLPSR